MNRATEPFDFPRSEIESHLERPPCPLCGGGAGQTVLEAEDDWNPQGPARGLKFAVRRCEECGVCFTSPRFRVESKRLPFLGGYPFYQRAKRSEGPPPERELRAFASRANRLQQAHPASGKLLDLGMGDGRFLLTMRSKGWSVSGIDCEPDVVAHVQRQLKLEDCLVADVENDPLPPGPFDAVTMWGVLQLIYRPQVFLEKVRGMLTPGGVIGVGLSNFSGAGARLFGKHWKGLGLPRHLVHFNPDSLQHLLERSGYEMVELSFETPYWIAGDSVQAMMPLPGLLGGVCRRTVAAMLSLVGQTRLGDTITAIARVSH